mmetsp:Transcript_60987/g.186140  ORF Transcript_60987/g.186140 Transcript_60987/m.186140 type:complete len:270 (-) Transcript_60987:52-861(-)
MQHQIKPGALLERLRIVHPEHLRVVPGPVELRVVRRRGAVFERPAVDVRGHHGYPRDEVEGVLQRPLPVRVLHHALLVLCRELRVLLHREHAHGELRHGVRVLRQRRQRRQHVGGHGAARVELRGERRGLLGRGDLACEQQPERRLGEPALSARRLRQLLVRLEERQAPVGDAFGRVQVGGLRDHGLDGARAVDAHLHRKVLDLRVAGLEELRLQRDAVLREGRDLALQLRDDGRRGRGRGGRAERRPGRPPGDDVLGEHRHPLHGSGK